MTNECDPIALVEACYDLAAGETEWLSAIAIRARPLMRTTEVLAYHLDVLDGTPRFRDLVHSDGSADALNRLRYMADLLDRKRAGKLGYIEGLQAKVYEKVVRAAFDEPADRVLLSEMKPYGPRWMYTLGVPGVYELSHLLNHHVDGNGLTILIGPRLKREPPREPERQMLQMLSAHIKAGLRLRRRLGMHLRHVNATPDGAVLDASAKVVHAEGDARASEIREVLERKAREIDRVRTRGGRSDDRALEVWQGLIDGRWSLIERFDVDGKRYLLAHKNPEDVVDPRGLGELESRVVGLAVRGYSDKLIGYHLGGAEGTVSATFARALRKLGISGRVELVRTLGRTYLGAPQSAGDPAD